MSARVLSLRPKLPRTKRPVRREDPVHISIKNYLEATLPGDWLVHHARNGGMSRGENGRAKGLGTKKGYPDLVIHGQMDIGFEKPCHVAVTGFIEVKPEGEYPDTDQRKMHARLGALGFPVAVCRSIDDAREFVRKQGWPTRDHLLRQ